MRRVIPVATLPFFNAVLWNHCTSVLHSRYDDDGYDTKNTNAKSGRRARFITPLLCPNPTLLRYPAYCTRCS